MTAQSVLTLAEVAERLRIDRHKVLVWIKAGELTARNVATSRATRPIYRITAEDLAAFLDGRASTPKPAAAPRARQREHYRELI